MNQEQIGRFIAACRKERGYTQAELAEKLGITDRAVSKWETGKSLPDASLMLVLSELLHISVNELLTGAHIEQTDYRALAEQTLVEMRAREEQANRKLLKVESVLTAMTVAASLGMVIAGILLAQYQPVAGEIFCTLASVIVVAGCFYAVSLEHDAGYYECPSCHKRYVPSMRAVIWAVHFGTTRRLRCPYCGHKGYHKKVLTK